MTAQKKPVPFADLTIEYHVLGELDGTTLAPDVDLDPASPTYNEPDARGIHVVQVPGNLGLIDPDGIGPAVQGDRCLPWVYLDSPVAGAIDSLFAVLDNVDRDNGVVVPAIQRVRFLTFGVPVFYASSPTRIPQGSVLGVLGYPAGGGTKIVRINIVAPESAAEYAAILAACCCAETTCPDPPILESQDPVGSQDTGQVVTFEYTGQNLIRPSGAPPNFFYVQVENPVPEPATGGFVQGTVTAFSATTATVDFDLPLSLPPGGYQIIAVDPEDPSCNSGDGEQLPLQIFNTP